MKQFFTKATLEASVWCKTCDKKTPHKVTGGRPQYCIPCFEKLEAQASEPKPEKTIDQATLNFME